MKELYVVNCCRTAVGSFGGSLKNTPAAQLGSIVVKEALKRANVAPENVDELMFGCILTAGLGFDYTHRKMKNQLHRRSRSERRPSGRRGRRSPLFRPRLYRRYGLRLRYEVRH